MGRNSVGWTLILMLAVAGCSVPPLAPLPAPESPEASLAPAGASLGRWIEVRKTDRKLIVFDDTTPIRTYPIVLGGDPVGAKLHEGDNRTPEGEYHISAKYPHAAWSRFMLIDYPTPINRNVYEWTRLAGLLPSGKAGGGPGVGGQVGIHGTPSDGANIRGDNWTKGCISLLNRDVEELYGMVDVGTRVVIER